MTQSSFSSSRSFGPTAARRDSPVRWALNALRLTKDAGAAIAVQEREGAIFVCVRKGETTQWVPYQKVMSPSQLQGWIRDGGFPRESAHSQQR